MLEAGRLDKWDKRFLELSKHVATWSKDPSTKTGAVIVDQQNRIVSIGFNGFPRGADDGADLYANREYKYDHIIHCEMNAILFANKPVAGCTLYTWPFLSCIRCAAVVAQAGITRVCAPEFSIGNATGRHMRWAVSLKASEKLFHSLGITVDLDTEEAYE